MENPKNILVFHGSPGIGKTYFCAALLEWMHKTFNSFRYHREEDLLRKLRQHIQNESGDYAIMLEHMIDDDFVILDDVGSGIDPKRETQKNLEWRKEIFFSFLDYRYRMEKPTLITSNFSSKDFKEIYAERVCSRLFSAENTFIEISDKYDKRMWGM